jgi:hypothetical protein
MAFSLNALRAAKSLLSECGLEEATLLLRELSGDTRRTHASPVDSESTVVAAAPAAAKRRPWTEEQKKAAAERMKKRWESGAMSGKVGRKKTARAKKDASA